MTKLTLPIEFGKRYRRRDGVVVIARKGSGMLAYVGDYVYSDRVSIDELVWLGTGRVSRHGRESPFDLVADADATEGHPHAALMAEYAKDAAVNPKPWTLWQYKKGPDHDWRDCSTPVWDPGFAYRRKPRTITINGREVPAPLREAPPRNTPVWWVTLNEDAPAMVLWHDFDAGMGRALQRGILFETEEGAEAARGAILEALK